MRGVVPYRFYGHGDDEGRRSLTAFTVPPLGLSQSGAADGNFPAWRRRIVGIPRCMAYRDGFIYDMLPHTCAAAGDAPLDPRGCERASEEARCAMIATHRG